MNIQENVSLAAHSTMRLGGKARYLVEVNSDQQVKEAVEWATSKNLLSIMIGDGSNIIWKDEGFPGLIIVNQIGGRDVLREDASSATIRLGGGENWDEVVSRAVDNGWSGIEFLSLIPGKVGAAPVQNIGAYGAELSTVLTQLRAYDKKNNQFIDIPKSDCDFGYRSSRFKTIDKHRFFITSITLELHKKNPEPPFYDALSDYIEKHQISEFTPAVIRQAVIAIRSSKLPDPSKVANNGSFFTNPIVDTAHFASLKHLYPGIKGWPLPDNRVKLAAGWLVEKAGFKGIHDHETGMATWPKQALVLVNENAKTTADLLRFKQKIIDAVAAKFKVNLEQEPELLP